MHVILVHDLIDAADGPDSQDVLVQAAAVEEALHSLGHTTGRLACTLDLAALGRELRDARADLVFNLVESLDGRGSLIHLAPSCFDALGLPYTGCRAEAMFLTSNKLLAKQWMRAAGLPTPVWVEADALLPEALAPCDWIDQVGLGTRLHRSGQRQRSPRADPVPRSAGCCRSGPD